MFHKIQNNYFLTSFFWSTFSKILNAVLGFVSVPLLIRYFGKADYGLLSIATACNGYMQLMDLGMNVGAVKYFSQWEAEGKRDLIHRVARANISFYILISAINILGLLVLACFGEKFFSITHEQFLQLRICFFILALFSIISWVSTAFSQLLTAYKRIDFTMKIQCFLVLLKVLLIVFVFAFRLSLSEYFFYLTLMVSLSIVPYAYKCKKDGLIDTIVPGNYWDEFKIVLTFSLSLFALSLFQVTATQSRPIILSIFSETGAESVTYFRIVEVIPQFIITVCATLTSIFLPKSSEMILKCSNDEIQTYVNNLTSKTTTLVCFLCFPFIVGSKSILNAYVGTEFEYLSKWLIIWCFFLIVQMHSTPAFSFILAKGKTKILVVSTAIACVLSIIVNVSLCKTVPVGSAIIGYVVYMLCLIGVYYYLYDKYLNLRSKEIFYSFLKPVISGILCCAIPYLINLDGLIFNKLIINRITYILEFITQSLMWLVPYMIIIKLLINKTKCNDKGMCK